MTFWILVFQSVTRHAFIFFFLLISEVQTVQIFSRKTKVLSTDIFFFLHCRLTVGNMKRLGFRVAFVSTEVESWSGAEHSQTTEPQLFYIACCGLPFFISFYIFHQMDISFHVNHN